MWRVVLARQAAILKKSFIHPVQKFPSRSGGSNLGLTSPHQPLHTIHFLHCELYSEDICTMVINSSVHTLFNKLLIPVEMDFFRLCKCMNVQQTCYNTEDNDMGIHCMCCLCLHYFPIHVEKTKPAVCLRHTDNICRLTFNIDGNYFLACVII